MEIKEEEYRIEAFKESFDGERTDVFTKHIMSTKENLTNQVLVFVRLNSAGRFNVWKKVKVEE